MESETAITHTINTATGRRDQCFSPSPAYSGNPSITQMTTMGAMRRSGVSRCGGARREDRVDPKKRHIRLGHGLDNRRIGRTAGADGAKEKGARHDRQNDGRGESDIFPRCVGNEGHAVFVDFRFILLQVGASTHQAAGHRPLIDAEAKNHPHMHADQRDQNSRNDENVQCEKAREGRGPDNGAAEHDSEPASAPIQGTLPMMDAPIPRPQ